MRARLGWFLIGVLSAYAGVALAQTVFASLRVNGQSDLRGAIVNGSGNVTVADAFDIDVGGGTDEMNVTAGLVTVPGDLTVSGTCTGCGGGGSAGVWTATLTNTTNVAASVYGGGRYSQVSDVVTFSFDLTSITTTAGAPTFTNLGFSLPVASNFGGNSDLAGTCTSSVAAQTNAAVMQSDSTNDRGLVLFQSRDTNPNPWKCVGSYRVLP